jgi:hypothetical protein
MAVNVDAAGSLAGEISEKPINIEFYGYFRRTVWPFFPGATHVAAQNIRPFAVAIM